MIVKIKRLNPNAKIPTKAHDSDFCYDCYATSEEEVAPGVWKYGLGFSLQPQQKTRETYGGHNDDYGNYHDTSGITLRPRSSIYKTGMLLSNSIGTVDQGYTGEVSVIFYHVLKDLPRYKVGDKVCQMHVDWSTNITMFIEGDLDKTDRGDGGFGSTN